jgi:GAF domain-containing protein
VDRLTAHAGDWSERRVLDEGLDLVRDVSWADACGLFRVEHNTVTVLHTRPSTPEGDPSRRAPHVEPAPVAVAATLGAVPAATGVLPAQSVPTDWFPWGLAPIQADRFVLIDDARSLPATPDSAVTLGSLGVRSCLHLPLRQKARTVGALQLFWTSPRLAWDDDRGRLLRTLGRFLLSCDERSRP